jgi:hypothetical protein
LNKEFLHDFQVLYRNIHVIKPRFHSPFHYFIFHSLICSFKLLKKSGMMLLFCLGLFSKKLEKEFSTEISIRFLSEILEVLFLFILYFSFIFKLLFFIFYLFIIKNYFYLFAGSKWISLFRLYWCFEVYITLLFIYFLFLFYYTLHLMYLY